MIEKIRISPIDDWINKECFPINFEERVLHEKQIFTGKIIDLTLEEVRLPNGKTARREIVHHNGAVGILPLTEDHCVLLVEQWRAPMRRLSLEIPAGKIEKDEKIPIDVAKRELNEEIRFEGQLELFNQFYCSPGFSDEFMYLYRATNLVPVDTILPQDDDEFIQLIKMTLPEAKEAITQGRICDAKTILALYYWELTAKE